MNHLNCVFIVGRIDEIIEVNEKHIKLLLDISYKTSECNDIIKRKAKIDIYNTIAEKVLQYCKPRDLISIKAYVDMNADNQNILVAEQVSFMTTSPPVE